MELKKVTVIDEQSHTSSVPRMIAGFGRSGTTWVQDVLAEANRLRAVFEPLHPDLVPGARDFAHGYLPAEVENPDLYKFFHHFFHEDYQSLWADYRIVRSHLSPKRNDFTSWRTARGLVRRYLNAGGNVARYRGQRRFRERIVKCVRANMMLSWLQEHFKARIVFIIRHPAAVIMSQMKAPRTWNPYRRIEVYRNDRHLLQVLDTSVTSLLMQDLDQVEAYTLSWCIENSIALAQAKERNIPVIFYERLLEDGRPEWSRILSTLDLHVMPGDQLISKPSQQAWGKKAMRSELVRQYASWMDAIDRNTAASIQKILDKAAIGVYAVSHALPGTE